MDGVLFSLIKNAKDAINLRVPGAGTPKKLKENYTKNMHFLAFYDKFQANGCINFYY